MLDELDLIRTIQTGVRRETRVNSQTTARLERTVTRLAQITALHQQGFRIIEQDREELRQHRAHIRQDSEKLHQYRVNIRQNQENINRILAYLENPNRGETLPN
ncbi:MAG: hypothetical protein QNJ36_20660 [Calothrix sp. MO_167.B42]|nr:hypothetical protein [Calothrix sp. MO_167.B42]